MGTPNSYLVFIPDSVIPFLEALGIIEINEINNCKYIACSKYHQTPHLIELITEKGHLWNHLDHDFLIALPYHSVVYICSAENPNNILGFQTHSGGADNPPDQLARS